MKQRVVPTTDTWTGLGGGTYAWNNPANWNNGIPVTGEDLVFPANPLGGAASMSNLDNMNGLSVNSLSINAAGYNLAGSGATLILSNGGGNSARRGFQRAEQHDWLQHPAAPTNSGPWTSGPACPLPARSRARRR